MDISRVRFPFELVKIIELIADSHFVAFDLEFSGIAARRKDRTKPKLQEVYAEVKQAAERYQVLQVGLTVVHEDLSTGRYMVRPYNFNISPIPLSEKLYLERVWSFQSGAVDFLIRNGFDFGLPYAHGVPYLSRQDEQDIRSGWLTMDLAKATLRDMPIKGDDAVLVDHVRASVKQWQEEAPGRREDYLNIPNTSKGGVRYLAASKTLNRYQIRLVHQIIRNEYPKLKSAGKGHFIQIRNLDDRREASDKLQLARYRDRDISRATEFRWLVEAISGGDITQMPPEYVTYALPDDVQLGDGQGLAVAQFIDRLQRKLHSRKRVLIGHNCFTDLVYLYSCFIGQLPDSVDEFQDRIRGMFPTVVDTKFIASFGKGWQSTSLQDVELDLQPDGPGVPVVEVPADFDRYTVGQRLHEAGYDSLLTAKIAIHLSAKLETEAAFPAYQASEASKSDAPVEDDVSEHYVTAPESNADSEVRDLLSTVQRVLSTPLTMVGNFFSSDVVSAGHQFADQTEDDVMDPVEHRDVRDDREDDDEQEQIGKHHDNLVRQASSFTEDVSIPPTQSLDSSADGLLTEAEILDKVKTGELMPRWEGGRGFWQYFGQKLQVNGAEEEICYL